MNKLDKVNKLISLYDEYKELLTGIQRETFEMYYFDDMSMSEIAKETNTSTPSISDKLKNVEINLLKFEKILSLAKIKEIVNDIIENEDKEENEKIIAKLKKI